MPKLAVALDALLENLDGKLDAPGSAGSGTGCVVR